ncbi:MAG: hypothetical protein ACOC5T_01205 [Elusimicrobiota bacterium]
MAITYFKFKKYEHLVDDELFGEALALLDKRRKKMANWIKENDPKCASCGIEEKMEYEWNEKKCNECGYVEEYTVPPPAKGGLTLSRKLPQIMKELFGNRIRAEKQREEPSEQDLRELEFTLDDFSDFEYTEAERKFLLRRYNQLLDEIGRGNQVDRFAIHQLAKQELKLMGMERKDKFKGIKSTDKKREIDIYDKLVKNLKAAKAQRENVKDKTIIEELAERAKEMGIEQSVRNHVEHLKSDYREYLKKSASRRAKIGNDVAKDNLD